MRRNAFPKQLLFILVVMLCVASPTVNVQTETWNWRKVSFNYPLESVDMVSSTDGWAVGGGGSIIRWNGTSWKKVASPTTNALWSVDMVSSTEGWAVNSRTDGYLTNQSIIRWDGTSWKIVISPTAGVLKSVDMVNSTDGWAVGSASIIIRWDGTSWSRLEDPITYPYEFPNGIVIERTLNEPLESIDMVSSTDGWAVGWKGTIIHWNGTSWSLIENMNLDFELFGSRTIWSVDMVSSTDGWAVGDGGRIIRWDGSNWEKVTSPLPGNKHLFSVDMVNSTDGWAVGSDGCIIHWDGAIWSNVTSPTTAWLSCVDMVSSSDGWIVGADGIYRWQKEAAGFPTDYLIIIIAVVVVIVVAWVFIRNRMSHTLKA